MNWDDTRFFLALAREGTLSAAARVLSTRHTTVARRIQNMEQECGTRLFVSTPEGYHLTEHGERALAVAQSAEEQMFALERSLKGSSDQLTGELRLTTVDVVLSLLGPTLSAFGKLYPDIELSLLVDNRVSDLHRREADIALRMTNNPPEHLVGRRVKTFDYAPFGKKGAYNNQPLHKLPWIMWEERLGAKLTERWFKATSLGRPAAYRIDAATSLVELIAQGLGTGLLPVELGRHHGFEQLGPCIEALSSELWVLTHPDLRHAARIVAFMDTLRAHFDP